MSIYTRRVPWDLKKKDVKWHNRRTNRKLKVMCRVWKWHVPGYFSVTFFSRNCLYNTLLVSSSQFIASYRANCSRNSSFILKTQDISCSKWPSSIGFVCTSVINSISSLTWYLVWCVGVWYTPPVHSACVSSLNKLWWWQHSDSDRHDWGKEDKGTS